MGRQTLAAIPRSLRLFISSLSLLFTTVNGAPVTYGTACAPRTFSFPEIFGAQGVSILATPVLNYTSYPQTLPESQMVKGGLSFCNVTVTYTHLGQNDRVNAQIWLPINGWNGRYVTAGGYGFSTGRPDGDFMATHVYENSAAGTTDGGFYDGFVDASWVVKSPGNTDYTLLNNFALNALNDLPIIAKAVIQQYYGTAASYSYFHGCSMGGRQGHQMAQSNPAAYNGILANAPALHADEVGMSSFWPQVVMNNNNYFPPPCEFDAIIAAAISACDLLDGVSDGVIARPDLCTFDPASLVGKTYSCNGVQRTYSESGAAAANALWKGSPVLASGQQSWIGMPIGTPLRDPDFGFVETVCDENNENCTGLLNPLFVNFPRYFITKDPSWNPPVLTEDEFNLLLATSRQQYYSLLGTADADLSRFKKAGGKMMTFHGLADQSLSPRTTKRYVEAVKQLDSGYQDHFRYFEVPGLHHCLGGDGAYPLDGFNALVKWVEQGVRPETVVAVDQASIATGNITNAKERLICVYPKVPQFLGGDPDKSSSYTCIDTVGGAS